MATISIIVPVYKAENYLHRCIDSILGQTYGDFELILVDDGSPDRSGKICDNYAAMDSRIHVIHQENEGCSAARNSGIEWALQNSNSQWVSFVDSDDWIHKEYFAVLMDMAEKYHAQIAMCGRVWVSEYCEDKEINQKEFFVLEPEQALVQHHEKCLPPWGKVIWKPLLKELRFPVGIRYEDAWITHILTLSANCVAVCPEKLYYYYNNPESFTRVAWSEERLTALTVHGQRLEYFLKNGYHRAYRKEQELYMEILTGNLQTLMYLLEDGEIYRKNFLFLRQKHREAFQKAREEKVIRFEWKTMWFYFFAARTDAIWKTAKWAQKIYHKLKND